MLEIDVVKVRGKCPIHKVGDKIVIDGASIVLDRTDALGIHALSVITPRASLIGINLSGSATYALRV